MSSSKPHILIIGAGIGGLTAAVSLQKAGCTVEIHERAQQLRAVGAGITVQPNAVAALRELGLGERVERAGRPLAGGGLWHADGSVISRLNPDEAASLSAELNAPIIGIHRATLHEILLEGAGTDRLHLARVATRYELTSRGARVHFQDGSAVEADAVVGADGIHSVCRQQSAADGEPDYAGYYCWRGITASQPQIGEQWGGELWGKHLRFGGCSVDGGRFYWFAVANGPAGGADAAEGAKAAVLARMADYAPIYREAVESTPSEAIFRADIHDRKPLTRWGEGRVTLLGDAAHAMTPNLGQGACQAIESALVLGLEVQKSDDLTAAFANYARIRQPRVHQVIKAARQLGAIAQWSNPVATAMRNVVFKSVPSSMLRRQLADSWKLPYGGFSTD